MASPPLLRVALTREDGLNNQLETAIRDKYMEIVGFTERMRFDEIPSIENLRGPDYDRLAKSWDKDEFNVVCILGPDAARIYCEQASVEYKRVVPVGRGCKEVLVRERKVITPVDEKIVVDGTSLAEHLPVNMGPRILLLSSDKLKEEVKKTLDDRGFDTTVYQVLSPQPRTTPPVSNELLNQIDLWTFGSKSSVKAVQSWVQATGIDIHVAICVNKSVGDLARTAFGPATNIEIGEKSSVKGWAAEVVKTVQKIDKSGGIGLVKAQHAKIKKANPPPPAAPGSQQPALLAAALPPGSQQPTVAAQVSQPVGPASGSSQATVTQPDPSQPPTGGMPGQTTNGIPGQPTTGIGQPGSTLGASGAVSAIPGTTPGGAASQPGGVGPTVGVVAAGLRQEAGGPSSIEQPAIPQQGGTATGTRGIFSDQPTTRLGGQATSASGQEPNPADAFSSTMNPTGAIPSAMAAGFTGIGQPGTGFSGIGQPGSGQPATGQPTTASTSSALAPSGITGSSGTATAPFSSAFSFNFPGSQPPKRLEMEVDEEIVDDRKDPPSKEAVAKDGKAAAIDGKAPGKNAWEKPKTKVTGSGIFNSAKPPAVAKTASSSATSGGKSSSATTGGKASLATTGGKVSSATTGGKASSSKGGATATASSGDKKLSSPAKTVKAFSPTNPAGRAGNSPSSTIPGAQERSVAELPVAKVSIRASSAQAGATGTSSTPVGTSRAFAGASTSATTATGIAGSKATAPAKAGTIAAKGSAPAMKNTNQYSSVSSRLHDKTSSQLARERPKVGGTSTAAVGTNTAGSTVACAGTNVAGDGTAAGGTGGDGATADKAGEKDKPNGPTWEEVSDLWNVIQKWEISFADLKKLHDTETKRLNDALVEAQKDSGGVKRSGTSKEGPRVDPSGLSVLDKHPRRFTHLEEAQQYYNELRAEYEDFRTAKFVEVELLHERINTHPVTGGHIDAARRENELLRQELIEARKQIEYFTMYATI